MIDRNINLAEKKQLILDIIKKEGPCLPSSICSRIGMPLLLTSALFSEMRAEKMLKISNLKIGGSPLYFLEGQETLLENFVKHLEPKEREAFELLKREQVINEEQLEPAHRVAFREMKDFAFPFHVKTENGEKIFWRFHTTSQEIVNEKVSMLLKRLEKKELKEEKVEGKEKKEKVKEKEKKLEKAGKEKKIAQKKKTDREQIEIRISEWLQKKNFAIEKELDDEASIISTSSQIGKLHFLLIIKLKKSINEADLSLAYQRGQNAKMPVLFLTNGSLTKKAQTYLEQLGKLIVVEKL